MGFGRGGPDSVGGMGGGGRGAVCIVFSRWLLLRGAMPSGNVVRLKCYCHALVWFILSPSRGLGRGRGMLGRLFGSRHGAWM